MTYLELINQFWQRNCGDPLPQSDTTLYMYLLHKCNSGRWLNPFKLRTATIMYETGLSRDAIDTSKNRLKKVGLIDFNKGKGRSDRYYQIVGAAKKGDGIVGNSDNSPHNSPHNNSHNSAQTPYIVKDIKIKDIETTSQTRARAREATDEFQIFFEKFFDCNRQASIEALCMELGIQPDKLKELALSVVNEWRLAELSHRDFSDAARHLMAQIRIKHQDAKRNETKRTDYNSAREQADAEFAKFAEEKLRGAGLL